MRMPSRDERMVPLRYDSARVELSCPTTSAHVRSLVLAHVTVYADGWARWLEDGQVYVGYVQSGSCCNPPAVSVM